MRWERFPRYVSVGERRAQAQKTAQRLNKGRPLTAVASTCREVARTFWGLAWCENLHSYSDYANRLPRGRSYLRNGCVIDLQIEPKSVTALVQGSDLYKIQITIKPLAASLWTEFRQRCAGKIANLLDLLQGRLPQDVLHEITAKKRGLFPAPPEIRLSCSCPDSATMCKHVAATLYGVAVRLDEKPELFFVLRGVEMQELIAAAGETAVAPLGETVDQALAGADLSEIFGVEIDAGAKGTASPAQGAPKRPPAQAAAAKKPRTAARKKPVVSRRQKGERRKSRT